MKDIIQVLKRIAEQLEIMNLNNGNCKHELEELYYFYDDDWGVKGSKAWGKQGSAKTFHYCKNCGQVFVRDRDE